MHKFAKDTASVATRGGGTAIVKKGQVWSSHDPIVIDNPTLFSDSPTVVHGKQDEPVEEATADPGAKRSTKARKGV